MSRKPKWEVWNNYFLQFIFFSCINFALNGLLVLLLHWMGRMPEGDHAAPLGAGYAFIVYDNLLEAFLTVILIDLFRRSGAFDQWKKSVVFAALGGLLYLGKGLLVLLAWAQIGLPYQFAEIILPSGGALLFRFNGVLAGLLLYHRISRDAQRRRNMMAKELELSQLNNLKIQAELEALQAKVNPHFLYNSLNSIAQAVEDDPVKARNMTYLLSKFFRLSINPNSRHYWPVQEEMDLVQTYLAIEKIRFGARFDSVIHIEPGLESYLLPRFLIQPLVENAIKHGISKLAAGGILLIDISATPEMILIKVGDNGPPFSEGLQQGYGLRSVAEKVRLLGGQGAHWEISSTAPALNANLAYPTKYVRIHLAKHAAHENHHY